MFITLDRDWYLPGEMVEGKIYFELFMPSLQNKLMMKIEGKESFPERLYESVFQTVNGDPNAKFNKKYRRQSCKVMASDIPVLKPRISNLSSAISQDSLNEIDAYSS